MIIVHGLQVMRNKCDNCDRDTKGSFQKKKQPNIWKFPYVWGMRGSGGGPFPYVFTIVPKCF